MYFIEPEIPKITKNRIDFNWISNKKIPNIFKDSFFVEYKGLEINIQNDTAWFVFWGLFAPLLPKDEKVVVFGYGKDFVSFGNFWLSFLELINVNIIKKSSNTINKIEGNINLNSHKKDKNIGILYGGGKDSRLVYEILKNEKNINIYLLNFISPLDHTYINQNFSRREKLIFDRLNYKEANIKKIDVITNVRSISPVFSYMLELYISCSFPIIENINLDAITFSFEYCHFFEKINEKKVFMFKKSRPEYLNFVSENISKIIGKNFNLFNPNIMVPELTSFSILSKMNKNNIRSLVMCESSHNDEVFCNSCTKCATFFLFGKYVGVVTDEEFSNFFENSTYIKNVINKLDQGKIIKNKENKWLDGITASFHADSFFHVLYKMSKDTPLISNSAKSNLNKLIDAFSKNSPAEECFFEELASYIPDEYKNIFLQKLSQYTQSSKPPKVKQYGKDLVMYDTFDKIKLKLLSFETKKDIKILKNLGFGMSTKFRTKVISFNGTLKPLDLVLENNYKLLMAKIKKSSFYKGDGYVLSLDVSDIKTSNVLYVKNVYSNKMFLNKVFQEIYFGSEAYKFDLCKKIDNYFLIDSKIQNIQMKFTCNEYLPPYQWGNALAVEFALIEI